VISLVFARNYHPTRAGAATLRSICPRSCEPHRDAGTIPRESRRIIERFAMTVNGCSGVFFSRALRRWQGPCIALACAVPCASLAFGGDVATPSAFRSAVFPSGASFALEIAADPATRAKGYMYREHVGAGEAMLFVFDTSGFWDFWMKNCEVALDIIWLDDGLRVVDIAHDRPPCAAEGPCPRQQPLRAARYVLEVAAGTARREGLRLGDTLVLLDGAASQ
jgi:uncharacterized membrane protein (UPF0127 family)